MESFEIASSPAASEPPERSAEPAGRCVFADYLSSLDQGPAPADRFDAFWLALRELVRAELRRRGLWLAPPSFVGLVAAGERFGREAVDELTSDCFVHLLERARILRHHAETKPRIDGLIRLEVRHFLHERQRRADPLGYRLYGMLSEAVEAAIERGDLRERQDATTAGRQLIAAKAPDDAPLASPADVDALTRRWADELLPDLVTGWGKRRASMVDALATRCGQMASAGILATTFDELLDPLRRAVRVRWQAVLAVDGVAETRIQGTATSQPAETPDLSFEERESFKALVDCVSEAIDRGEGVTRRSRQHTMRLWRFLRLRSCELSTGEIPSRRQLAELLGIPRSMLPGLLGHLGRLIDHCRARACAPCRGQEESHEAL